jgi:hypothetical protein
MAPQYDIKPRGVVRVLKGTIEPAQDLRSAYKTCGRALEGVPRTCQSGLIVKALNDFMAYYADPLKELTRRVNGAPRGAASATRAYLDGDREMVKAAQRLPYAAESHDRVERGLR